MAAQYNFEGDFENINERQLEFINKVILEQDLKVNKVFFEPVGQAGDNFVGNVKRITIEGDSGTLQMIVKVAPSNEVFRQTMNSFLLFTNEHVMYTEILPKLVQLQKAADVPKEEQLRFAKCYGSLAEAPNEVILLEDLKTSDFVMLNKFVSLSDICVRSILKNLAILHSLSYVLKKNEPETYNLFKGKLFNTWTINADDETYMSQVQHFENDVISVLDNDSHKNTVRNKVMDVIKHAVKLSKYEDGNKYSVIQQGDAWTNNIMFRFEDDKCLESIMIDYQISKNSNPVVDILFMIFNCTDHNTRSQHFYKWIDYYHIELDKSLSNFGLKANFMYPRDQLDADLKRYGKLLFGLSIILASVLMRDPNEVTKMMGAMENSSIAEVMETVKMKDLEDNTLLRLRNRIIGLIDSFNEFGLL